MATIEKRGDKYRVRYAVYEDGKRIQRNKSFAKSKDAKDFAAKVQHKINTGNYAYARGVTFGEYLRDWMDTYCQHLRPNALADIKVSIDKHIIPALGNTPLDRLTTTAIQKFYNKLLETEYRKAVYEQRGGVSVLVRPAQTYSPKTVRNIHGALHKALQQAVITNLIARNPSDYVHLPKKEQKDYVIPTPEQFKVLLRELAKRPEYPVVLTCSILGCRRGEALGLYWTDIDFQNDTVSFKRAYIMNSLTREAEIGPLKTKNSKRTVPLPDILKAELLSLKEERAALVAQWGMDTPFVFVNAVGQPFRPDSCSRTFRETIRKVGLDGMRLHDLRHTFITYLLEAGENPKTSQEFVGHADAGFMLKQYAHVVEGSKKKAGEKIVEKLFR